MTQEQIIISYAMYDKLGDLSSQQIQILTAASAFSRNAYAPYSLFQVGAALLLEDLTIITGCNQENASYPCGICAERVALFTYGTSKADVRILKIAISTKELNSGPVAPCGLCRQVLSEFEDKNKAPIEIILGHFESKIYIFPTAKSLLPFHFHSGFLKPSL